MSDHGEMISLINYNIIRCNIILNKQIQSLY